MTAARRDRLLGVALLVIALTWTGIVYSTIPGGQGDGDIGPRAFPFLLGLILAALSAYVIFGSFRAAALESTETSSADEARQPESADRMEIMTVISVFGLIVGYCFFMEKIGFLLATPIAVGIGLWVLLKVRKPTLVGSLAFGITIGCWLMFGKLLGAYLPPGTWISL